MNPPDSPNSDPSAEYAQWYANSKGDAWVGEALMLPEGREYDPLTREMIIKAHATGFIENTDVELLGVTFKEVYDNIDKIIQERFPGIKLHELMADWEIFESNGKTE